MSKSDPTRMRRARTRATRLLTDRLSNAEKLVKSLFRSIQRTRKSKEIIKNNAIYYDYNLSAQDLEYLANEIDYILNSELLQNSNTLPDYYKSSVETPQRAGTLDEGINFNQLIAAAIVSGVLVKGVKPSPVDVQSLLLTPSYRNALDKAYAASYNNIKTLSQTTSSQVMQQIKLATDAGKTPLEVRAIITDRFDVSKSSAQRIADTEVNKIYTDARMAATEEISAQTGLRSAVIHISALTSTTRQTHAARHGKVYTTVQQREWWNTGANRINCKCDVEGVLVDAQGRVVDKEYQQEVEHEGKEFFS